MKKLGICLFIIVLGVSCTQNNVEAQSNNNAQRIIGTWIGDYSFSDATLTFNANGTFESSGHPDFRGSGNYIVTDSLLILENMAGSVRIIYYYFSTDARVLVLSLGPILLRKQ